MMRCCFTAIMAVAAVGFHDGPNPAAKPTTCELLSTKHLAVSAKINGQGPYRLIFDTGSPVVLLTTKVAREAKIGESTRKASKNKSMWPGQSVAGSIEVGSSKTDEVPVAILDHPTLKAIEGMVGPVDGIIGFPFFARFKTTIDYAALQITLEPNGYVPEDVFQSVGKRFDKHAAKTLSPAGQWGLDVDKPDDQPGVSVKAVYANGAAATAGVRVGDRILTMDGRWTDSVDDCFLAASVLPVGQQVPVVIRRQDRELTIRVTPGPGF
jgi:Aspartyl protease/PDZ domain